MPLETSHTIASVACFAKLGGIFSKTYYLLGFISPRHTLTSSGVIKDREGIAL